MAGILLEGASLVYHGDGRDIVALDRFDLSIPPGEPLAIIGPSGCGKSSLLLAVAGLVPLSSGRITIAGEPVSGPRLRTALILQDFGLLPWKDALSNAALGLQIRGQSRGERVQRATGALERVGLGEFLSAYPAELSGGMRQRLALARALALDADVLLMDEPLSALDALTRENLQDLLLALWCQRRHTSVLVTHSIEEAVFLGRRIAVMTPRPGRVHAIVDNPGMGEPGYRAADEYHARCTELRELLMQEAALGSEASLAVEPE